MEVKWDQWDLPHFVSDLLTIRKNTTLETLYEVQWCLSLSQGSNLCLDDYDGRTPLHIAACEGHLKVVQYLLSHGATVYAKDRYGDTPLCNAVRFRYNLPHLK